MHSQKEFAPCPFLFLILTSALFLHLLRKLDKIRGKETRYAVIGAEPPVWGWEGLMREISMAYSNRLEPGRK